MKESSLRQYSMVKFITGSCFPFIKDEIFIYLGEIPNMLGHCVVASFETGEIYSGYHIENFKEIPDDEV